MHAAYSQMAEKSLSEGHNANMAKCRQLVILGKGQGVVLIILLFQLRTGDPSAAVPAGLGAGPDSAHRVLPSPLRRCRESRLSPYDPHLTFNALCCCSRNTQAQARKGNSPHTLVPQGPSGQSWDASRIGALKFSLATSCVQSHLCLA